MSAEDILSLLTQIERMTPPDEVEWVITVHNKEVLMEIIRIHEDWRIRKVAISCLRDKALLEEVMHDYAKESTNYRFAEECLANLTNR